MPVPLIAAPLAVSAVTKVAGVVEGVAKTIGSLGGLINTGSPRYMNGPLVSTVQDFLARIQAGDLAAIRQLNDIRNNPNEKDRKAWQSVWDSLVPQLNLTKDARALIASLDSSKAYLTTSDQPPISQMPVMPGGGDQAPLSAGPPPPADSMAAIGAFFKTPAGMAVAVLGLIFLLKWLRS